MNKKVPGLVFCIIMDVIGYLSFSMPVLAEFTDIIWAPISGYLFYLFFGGRFGITGGILNFIEEALPFTDFIPSFTIAWFIKHFSKEKVLPLTGQRRL